MNDIHLQATQIIFVPNIAILSAEANSYGTEMETLRKNMQFSFVRQQTLYNTSNSTLQHGRRKDFFSGGSIVVLPGIDTRIFPGRTKSGEISCYPLEINKTTLFAETLIEKRKISKVMGQAPLAHRFRCPCLEDKRRK